MKNGQSIYHSPSQRKNGQEPVFFMHNEQQIFFENINGAIFDCVKSTECWLIFQNALLLYNQTMEKD